MQDTQEIVTISQKIIESLPKDHPLHTDKHFIFFIKSLVKEGGSLFFFNKRLVSMLISSYEYFLSGEIPKIRIVNKPNQTILKNSTIMEAHTNDIKFLLDSIREYLNDYKYKTKLIINPIFSCMRDNKGKIIELKLGTEGTSRESFIYLEIEKIGSEGINEINKDLESVLTAVQHSVEDYKPMINKLRELNQGLKDSDFSFLKDQEIFLYEATSFLDWLLEDNFVFLGYCCFILDNKKKENVFQIDKDNRKGLFRSILKSSCINHHGESISDLIKEDIFLSTPLVIDKSPLKSIVHRRVPMDLVEIRELDKFGKPFKWHRFVGLFTRKALFGRVEDIPLLSSKLKTIMELNHVVVGSTMYREVVTVFNSLPKEVLFLTSINELDYLIHLIIKAYREQAISVFFRSSSTGSTISMVVALPEKYYSTHNAANVSDFFKVFFNADFIHYYQTRSHPGFWEIYYLISPSNTKNIPSFTKEKLEEEVSNILKDWIEKLEDYISIAAPRDKAEELIEKYLNVFPKQYQSTYSIETGFRDIAYFESFFETNKNQYDFRNENDSITNPFTTLRIYSKEKIILTDIMPILENFGLKVIDESAYHLKTLKADIYLHVFAVTDQKGKNLDANLCDGLLEQALEKVIDKELDNGLLNALITKTGMNYNEIHLLRAYYNYYFQIERIFTRRTVSQITVRYAHYFKLIFQFFNLKFNPNFELSERETKLLEVQDDALALLKEVTDINEDRILKAFYNLVDSTIRTNYFSKKNSLVLSIKIESKKVFNMPDPKPLYEIFVYSPLMEGIHLRGGKIARGGIRWSDRVDDYRTEVLALMKTQMTKNAVIVPVGSKGGFVLKNNKNKDPNYIKYQYQEFISGLLDLTDNIINEKVIHPENVICYDDDDSYLVVAADKGTAHLSDAANEMSAKYNFWLDDAFASGGSYGYDHKKEGITAKGAWECVKRHFRELGKNIQTEEFSVVGIGDMSGDVFGNGMLLSRKILLKAAFNHIHIFIDPNPDPEKSYKERERLFNLPKSSWKDYNPKLISKGGNVFLRNDKSITLTNEIKEFLKVGNHELSGDELIKLILKSDVELIWNGGIGTYVKSSNETNEMVGDKANDNVRINAYDMKAKVVGEGGNLGFTQLARVEYSYHGGYINTDAIDNSAGVDMSDHEVNLKILCNHLMNDGLIKNREERNQLLTELTTDLNQMIVKDNYLQTLAISIDVLRSTLNIDRYKELIDNLVQEKLLDVKSEFMLTNREFITYKSEGRGLLRPQLAILMAYEKMRVYHEILSSNIPDLPYCNKYLISYFPDKIYAKFNDNILKHRLKREIIATTLTNHVINTAGISFFYELKRDTGNSYANIIGAYLVVEDVLNIPSIRTAIYLLDYEVPAKSQYRKFRWIEKLLRFMVNWNINIKQCLIPDENEINSLKDTIWHFQGQLQNSMDNFEKIKYQKNLDEDIASGLPVEMAKKIIPIEMLENVFIYLPLAKKFSRSLLECHKLLVQVDETLRIEDLMNQMRKVSSVSVWDQVSETYIRVELQFVRYFLCKKILTSYDAVCDNLFHEKKKNIDDYYHWIERLKEDEIKSYQPFTVVLKFLWNLTN
ncbi:MAG: NAD-glutamate dehydrogenase [Spirochaetota bacterium]|nr:NAD-glutamate dehydrogenase [Spirochaetota bacterium]